ncbi:MAG: hypothetical protein SF182_08645 [Deltaproteobacteria bacterium]|nr:hypothetical protein [Deltaproteobacteria bacterium]
MSAPAPRRLAGGALLLLAVGLDLTLLSPYLRSTSLQPHQMRRAYYEPADGGIAVMLDEQRAGYITDVMVGPRDELQVPAGRTVAIPLAPGRALRVATLAPDRAPYVVVGRATEREGGPFTEAVVPVLAADGSFAARDWDLGRPWADDRDWLRQMEARCQPAEAGVMTVEGSVDGAALRLGACRGTLAPPGSGPLWLLVVAGPQPATATWSGSAWRQVTEVQWGLIGLVVGRIALLALAIGAGPTAVTGAALLAVAKLARPEAVLAWYASLPLAVALAVAALVLRRWPRRRALAWASGALVLALQVGAVLGAVARFDLGSFGKQYFTRSGDAACAIVGYSTVRGDTLRHGTGGMVERLDVTCPRCRGRAARFSREAQTLHWIRALVCGPDFPAQAGGEVVFVGGGNDDLFYRPASLGQTIRDLATVLRMATAPLYATEFQAFFDRVTQRVVGTIAEQQADIRAIAACAEAKGRRFRFVHDFLVYDLETGRSADRARTFAARRDAALAAHADFVDLGAAFGATAGVAWFHDFIHPSGVGQAQIADLLCRRLSEPAAAAPSP